MTDLKSLTLDELCLELTAMGEKAFRGKQIFNWIHKQHTDSLDDMTNISKSLRQRLAEDYAFSRLTVVKKLQSAEDGTCKYLFDLGDGIYIESVFMSYEYGNSVCISSQAGCRMGCKFCASTVDGLDRNLLPGEMAEQIYNIEKDTGQRISNIVIMGSGEPLDNYDNLLKFLNIINSREGQDIGMRHITVSTCGLVERIYDLAKERLQLTLAISLHAPNDEIRRRTMPIANKYPIDSVIAAAKYYADTTGRRVTYEYALISGVNDSRENAEELASRVSGTLCHINLIPVNDVRENNFIRSTDKNIKSFAEILKSKGIETTIRRRLGSDINAACGQLRKSYRNRGVNN